ncbi:MAG: aminotransferase class I/II-fold pyridoxal phosphate-dependent enzyme, partial [Candidatus Eisenbacteria bacterium]|nr:aminotransferase class I/II-fold pyridoxal phosphate-dependent enzyme [Candidatus Eisenbacteria bacterium]
MANDKDLAPESWVVAGGRKRKPGSPLNAPMITASNFQKGGVHDYSRSEGTETSEAFESLMGGLEGGEAVAFASGMAAATAIFELLPPKASIVIPDDCYHGVVHLAEIGQKKSRWTFDRLDLSHTQAWIQAVAECDLIWLESPSNPLLTVADCPSILAASRKAGNLIAVDNTFATPLNQQPLVQGADVVMHSATKFLGGHSDLLSGVVVAKDAEVAEKVRETRSTLGASPGALETYLATRGVRTLAVRLERAEANAAILADRLLQHPDVERVRYPGLPSDPNHEIAKRVLKGFGAMVSFDVEGGGDRATKVCETVRLILHATSLGGVE